MQLWPRRLSRSRPTEAKRAAELDYWRSRLRADGELERGVPFYEWAFTAHFGLDRDFYRGRRILDVGCGPRGSLEWAQEAEQRVGLDPLAEQYATLRSRPHDMEYVAAPAERIPFPAGHFDVVSAFNSLDHVEDVDRALAEIARVARPGAALLLLVDIEHEPTLNEPHRLDWGLVDRLRTEWEIVERRDLERPTDNLLANVTDPRPFDHGDPRDRPGVLSARMERRGRLLD